jgi:hypothetical protein
MAADIAAQFIRVSGYFSVFFRKTPHAPGRADAADIAFFLINRHPTHHFSPLGQPAPDCR